MDEFDQPDQSEGMGAAVITALGIVLFLAVMFGTDWQTALAYFFG